MASGGSSAGTGDCAPSAESVEDRLALDDCTGAVLLARRRAVAMRGDDEAARLLERAEARLEAVLLARLGDLSRPLRIVMSAGDIVWLSLDHRAGFLLSLLEGAPTSVDELLALSGMRRLDTLDLLCSLLDQRVVEIAERSPR